MTDEGAKNNTDSSKAKDPRSPQVEVFEGQVERIRTTATWLTTTFGALGAALIASLQIAGLSSAEGDDFGWAILGFSLGIVGATTAIAAMGWVLASVPRDPGGNRLVPDDVAESAQKQGPWIIGGFSSVDNLVDEWGTTSSERQAAYKDYADAYLRRKQNPDPKKADELESAEESAWHRHEAAAKRADLAMKSVLRLYHFSEAHEVRRRFEIAVKVLIGAVVATAIGIAIFATNVASGDTDDGPPSASPAVISQPVSGVLDLLEDAHDEFEPLFGEECDLDAIPVVVLGVSESSYDVVSVEGTGCSLARVDVRREQGLVTGGTVVLPETTTPDDSLSETEDTMRDPIGG